METEKAKLEKPRIWGLVGIMLLRGLLLGWQTISTWQVVSDPAYSEVMPGWAQPYVILAGVLAILCLVAAVLIYLYKRYGLIAAIAASGIDIVVGVLLIISAAIQPNVPGILVSGAIIYYSWKYLTQEPHSTFFT